MSLKDPNQIVASEHDDINNAKRVVVVGGTFDTQKFTESMQESMQRAMEKLQPQWPLGGVNKPQFMPAEYVAPEIVKETIFVPQIQIERIPEYITRVETVIEKVEVPVVVKETEIKFVEIPKYIDRVEYKTVEIPIVIKEFQTIEVEKKIPQWMKIGFIVQNIALIGLLIHQIIK